MISTPTMLLVAHGTRYHAGREMLQEMREKVADQLPETTVRLAFVDVAQPTPAEALLEESGEVVIVPAFLASGYHVRSDLPQQVRASNHRNTSITPALGPDPVLARVMKEKLSHAGWTGHEQVVMAVAGTNDTGAREENRAMVRLLEAEIKTPVLWGTIAQGNPGIAEVLEGVARPVYVAQYLLAEGLFSQKLERLADEGAKITKPLVTHSGTIELLAQRYRHALVSRGSKNTEV